ncbi:hypothetical protein B6V01_001830 [Methanosarcinales archaeon ex4572_44]|nr:MAG: hypothetical protein B6V01_001830 [Methanosarcinales archaeon ex4572_44]
MAKVITADIIEAYPIYLLRWQLSTPLLWYILYLLESYHLSPFIMAGFANFIGGLFFFPFDRYIFLRRTKLDKRVFLHLPLYLIRWQLTNFTLAGVIALLGVEILHVIIANLIGGIIFFWIDKFIFDH